MKIYVCNKCGYAGPIQVNHPRPHAKGPCPYYAAEAPEVSPEEREKLMKQFGLTVCGRCGRTMSAEVEGSSFVCGDCRSPLSTPLSSV